MRHFIFTILLVAPLLLTAQSKKEQIATLVLRVDSLSEVLVNELRNSGDFETFLNYFLLTVSSEQQIDSLIYVSSPLIMDFIDEEIGFGVFYNPGAICNLYNFHDNEYQGFSTSGWVDGIPSPNYNLLSIIGMSQNLSFFKNRAPEGGFCEKASSPNGIYYQQVSHIKAGIMAPERNEDYLEPLILKHLKKMLVVIQMNHWKVASMYFVEFNNKWFLLYLDACDCSA